MSNTATPPLTQLEKQSREDADTLASELHDTEDYLQRTREALTGGETSTNETLVIAQRMRAVVETAREVRDDVRPWGRESNGQWHYAHAIDPNLCDRMFDALAALDAGK